MPTFYFTDPVNLSVKDRFHNITCDLFEDRYEKPKGMITRNYVDVYDIFTAKDKYIEEVLGLVRNKVDYFSDYKLDDLDKFENYQMKPGFKHQICHNNKKCVYLIIQENTNDIKVFDTRCYAKRYRRELDKQRIMSCLMEKMVK